MRSKKLKVFLAVTILAVFLASDACAVGAIEWLLSKQVKLKTGTTILVHRLSGQVKYYWQPGRMMDDPSYDPEKNGSWRPVGGILKTQFQKQYNAERSGR